MPTALVISGGGSKGAFAVGAVKYLLERTDLRFDLFAGTSTGALIAPMVAALGKDALPTLVKEYTTVHDDDILGKRAPLTALVSESIFLTDPLRKRIANNVTQAVFDRLKGPGGRQVFLATVDVSTGQLVYFQTGPRATTDDGEIVEVQTRDQLAGAMLASAAIPVMMPPVTLANAFGAHPHVDGGVRQYAPIKIAIDAGATDIYCVILSPERKKDWPGPTKPLSSILQRTLDLLSWEVGDANLRLARLYTRGTRYVQEVKQRLRAKGWSEAQIADLFSPPGVIDPFAGKRAVSLHVIRPQRMLAGETLGFDPVAMKANLAYGEECAGQQWRTDFVLA